MSLVTLGAKPPPDFSDPLGILVACHRRIEKACATLARAAQVFLADEAARFGEAREAIKGALHYLDHGGVRHTEDEEFSVFPRLQGTEAEPIILALEAEHREHEAIYLAVRQVAEKLVETPAEDLAKDLAGELLTHVTALASAYAEHIGREDGELIPLAGKLLDAPQLRAIGLEMRIRRGGQAPG